MNVTIIKDDRSDLPGGDVLISLNELSEHPEYTYVITPNTKPLEAYYYEDKFGYKFILTDVIINQNQIKFGEVLVGHNGIKPIDQPQRVHIHPELVANWRN